MKRLGRITILTLSIVGLSLILGIATSHTVRAAVSALVTVSNTSANPVPNRDQDNPAQQPFQTTAAVAVPAVGYIFNVPLYSVPAGKRAVIEHLSGFGNCNPTPNVGFVTLNTLVGGQDGQFYGGMQSVGDCNWIVNLPLRAYADPGTEITVNVWTFQSIPSAAGVTVSGHLVNIP